MPIANCQLLNAHTIDTRYTFCYCSTFFNKTNEMKHTLSRADKTLFIWINSNIFWRNNDPKRQFINTNGIVNDIYLCQTSIGTICAVRNNQMKRKGKRKNCYVYKWWCNNHKSNGICYSISLNNAQVTWHFRSTWPTNNFEIEN